MTIKKEPTAMLTARVPKSLVKALDRVAERENRSRSAEVVVRLKASLKGSRQRSVA
jgi:predicted transcriptional regulator